MQKIIIKNFGAVEYAEIEIKKILVLIGEQASGKSTIAKLIYFFKSLKNDLNIQLRQDTDRNYFDTASDLIFPIREKFYDFFGSTYHLPNFEITFHYNVENDRYIRLTLNSDRKVEAYLSFIDQTFKDSASTIKRLLRQQRSINIDRFYEQIAYDRDESSLSQRLSSLLNGVFSSNQTDSLFIIASRNVTVGYSNTFEKYLFSDTQNNLENRRAFKRKEQTIDETLMLNFIERTSQIKKFFTKYMGFEGLIESFEEDRIKKEKLYQVKTKIEEILKGKYLIDSQGEKIVFDQARTGYVYLHNSSSGQQESIRILQDIFINILERSKIFRVLEEPEAHLFPVAQKQLIELLSLMVNQDEDNQIIITTHSPYVLTVFNNLLFAKRVVNKNPSTEAEVSEIIPQEFWLNANDFSAYSLGNHFMGEKTQYCESIFNVEKGTIRQNYLDTVSEMLGGAFNSLYSIHAKSFGIR
ncbi:ATP-binding protein [Pseudanabaena sp. FACHB-1277]|uniref:ATP-binding protein n=1 Tax=Pseudanabaena cinerea FACHB-1277 TaxID=2949581 RepID=A0A926Z5T9_9CYAN|nr:AAA family ATPase [Pseudanabaena cinerea]MBD2149988.1 ATP-binding protein [Pseudanabaena cinerea FACHB-1277]